MSDSFYANPQLAADHAFDHARQKAFLENVVSHLRGRSTTLLPFEVIRSIIGPTSSHELGLQQIPIDRIVGSVGKYQEFSRTFLPRLARDRARWKGVFVSTLDARGMAPIEVYQVGEVYFVIDGNHRVSVARQLGVKLLEAYVTKLLTPLPITSDTDLHALILEAEKIRFLQHTHLAELRPKAKVDASNPGAYKQLEDIILRHGCTYCLNHNCEINWEEAVTRWYDEDYAPLVEIIHAANILSQFPRQTETDLYLWIMEHRHRFTSVPGLDEDMDKLLKHLATDHNPGRIRSMLHSWLTHTA
jgi:hypothetical protein